MSENNNQESSINQELNLLKKLENIGIEIDNFKKLQGEKMNILLDKVDKVEDVYQVHNELLKEIKLLRKNLIDTIAKGILIGLIVAGVFSAIFTACVAIFSR